MIDPCRAAVPAHPLCANSAVWRSTPRHRVGPTPLVVASRAGRWPFCSTRCLFEWRQRNPKLWAASRLEPRRAAS